MALDGLDAAGRTWRQPAGVRLAAAVVGVAGLVLTMWAIAVSGLEGLSILLLTVWFMGGAVGAFRQRVEVTAQEVVIGDGLRTWRVPRTDLERLRWMTVRQAGWRGPVRFSAAGRIYLLRTSGRPLALPTSATPNVYDPRGHPAEIAAWFAEAVSMPIHAATLDG